MSGQLVADGLSAVIQKALQSSLVRSFLMRYAMHRIHHDIIVSNPDDRPPRVQIHKYYMLRNLLQTIDDAIKDGRIGRRAQFVILRSFLGNVLLNTDWDSVSKKLGFYPPRTLAISPTKKCNLACRGCYADSSPSRETKLSYPTFSRIVREMRELWNDYLVVISGGEPLLWEDEGKTILDIAAENPQSYFLMYTNGTLIDRGMAARLEEVGNITPAVSVEGLGAETDDRRGKGVFRKVISAFDNLHAEGVPFGISMTATRDNVHHILEDDVIDFYFDEMGAIYGWLFQYMPIGRKHTLDLMVTPDQRVAMYRRTMNLIVHRGIFITDFWNTGELSSGCISAGRPNGYAYIDWSGNVLPCVFLPYYSDNINDIFARGGSINDIVRSDFFASVRKWQDEYGFRSKGMNRNNWIAPCPYRDHHEVLRKAVEKYGAKPADENAAEALRDPDYYDGMVAYGAKFRKLTDEIWVKEYLEDTSIDLRKLPMGRRREPPTPSVN